MIFPAPIVLQNIGIVRARGQSITGVVGDGFSFFITHENGGCFAVFTGSQEKGLQGADESDHERTTT
ncbi:hypothetical protein [Desmospora profundinema]|uniref:Uncharacterized protein n=1 Tax=Desmospora profundinema TaxID=1571184 RepID=A0ABU1IHV5_9BACL|nr:hypothetical protein [Desmospora profundinema]MDR6224353.1 hypothetical protein [Desmospora profundinema]